MNSRIASIAVWIFLVSTKCWAQQTTSAQSYERLFGDEERRVLSTSSKEDDVALAKRLFEAAKTVSASPDFQRLLLGKTFNIASVDAAGYPVAIEAMDELGKSFPDEARHAQGSALVVMDKWYRHQRPDSPMAKDYLDRLRHAAKSAEEAGDFDDAATMYSKAYSVAKGSGDEEAADLQALAARQSHLKTVDQRVSKLKAKQAPLDVVSARELASLLLVELSQPAQASSYASDSGDPAIVRACLLAQKRLSDLTEAELVELGGLYDSFSVEASAYGKLNCLMKARAAYALFVATHKSEDVDRLAVRLADEKAAKAIKALPPGIVPPGSVDDPALVNGSSRTTFFGISATGQRMAFLVDVSGSMNEPVAEQGATRIQTLRAELSRSTADMSDTSQFIVVDFSSDAEVLGGKREWVEASPSGKKTYKTLIATLAPSGGTNPLPGLEIIFNLRPCPDAIYFLTDGEFDSSVVDQVMEMNKKFKVPIHCICLGSRAGEDNMKKIAKASRGNFVFVGSKP